MKPIVILGTGPSLSAQREQIRTLKKAGKIALFGLNNTYQDFDVDHWIACDPAWHAHYGTIEGDFIKWHWDFGTCHRHGYRYIEGRWGDGLSTDPTYIHYNHSSGTQAINIAAHQGYRTILLCGFDMHYSGTQPRHYFEKLSDQAGEYPPELRKFSQFDGLIECYNKIAAQTQRPNIINCTPGSALTCFPMMELYDAAHTEHL